MIKPQHLREIAEDVSGKMQAYRKQFITAFLMLVAHESRGGYYLRQDPSGPALGIIQMERETHDSIWQHCDNIDMYAARLGITQSYHRLKFDLQYNVFMARCYFIMDTRAFPLTNEGMAVYLKEYWNGPGKASADKYLMDYLDYMGK